MALHPREYTATLTTIFHAPDPSREPRAPQMVEVEWNNFPEQFRDYVRGTTRPSRPPERASGSQSHPGTTPTPWTGTFPSAPLPSVEENETLRPEEDAAHA